jgi:hypothetical protein
MYVAIKKHMEMQDALATDSRNLEGEEDKGTEMKVSCIKTV